jgi:tetratricopeptide (TPR) repeat protein
VRSTLPAAAVLLLVACQGPTPPDPGPRSASTAIRPTIGEGDRLLRAGRDDEAIQAYAAAIARAPASIPAHLRHVAALLRLGRRVEARRHYAARVQGGDASEAERVMAWRLETDGSSSALRRVYALAAERSPEEPWWQLAAAEIEVAEAEAWNRRRVDAIDRGDRAAERSAYAQALRALEAAETAVERAAATGPGLAEVDLYRGFVRAVEGDLRASAVSSAAAYRAAADAFERAVQRDRDLLEAWEGLGDVRLRTGDEAEALRAYRETVRLAPADAYAREALGLALHRVGRFREAAHQYRQAAVLDPRDGGPLLRLGDAFADDEQWDRAVAAYREALGRDGDALEAWFKIGAVLEHQGRPGEARVAFERYVEQGGERSATVQRRIERLLREEQAP